MTGGAGGGKSSELAGLVVRLQENDVPVLPVRLDQLEDGVLVPEKLGEQLGLPYPHSPVTVLAGVAEGAVAVLVVDQLDAVSEVSGRRTNGWALFKALLDQADRHPNLRVVAACREFDLEHDERMRKLKANGSTFQQVQLRPLSDANLNDALEEREVHSKLRPLLTVPLHLSMFLSLPAKEARGFQSRDGLFRRFWHEKRRKATRNYGRSLDLDGYVKRLTQWMSDNQALTAPEDKFDGPEADALASERVLVLTKEGYRFFHESFFDYLFARGFATSGRLLDLLNEGEQHLFRRGQVRQVLSFLRSPSSMERYERELRDVLLSDSVRFHIKRAVLQQLSAVDDLRAGEWRVLRELESTDAELGNHVFATIRNHGGWFDLLDELGFLDAGLSGAEPAEPAEQERCVSLLASSEVLEQRADRVAALLTKHRRHGADWDGYLRHVCLSGNVYHHRDLFDLFLSLVADGTLRGGEANGHNWWHSLYGMSKDRPDLLAEVIGVWLDDALPSTPRDFAWRHLQKGGPDGGLIADASQAPLVFARQVLPRVAAFSKERADDMQDQLAADPLWSRRSFKSFGGLLHETLLEQLAKTLESLAVSSPEELDRLLDPVAAQPQDVIAYLVLRAWTASPGRFGERLARYLAEDPRRLKIGYGSWSAPGEPAVIKSYRSIEAVRVAASACSNEAFADLERAIVELRDGWEARHPNTRGERQLQLLNAMGEKRLSSVGRSKLAELQTKFPKAKFQTPKPTGPGFVGSPIGRMAQEKMADANWLSAMRKYTGDSHDFNEEGRAVGGASELAAELGRRTREEPRRFAALALEMPDDVPSIYFDHVLIGVADAVSQASGGPAPLSVAEASDLLQRVYELPDRPCGRWSGYLIQKWEGADWPASILDLVVWYAEHDPSPKDELWREDANGGATYYGGNPYEQGMNSARGAIASAVASLLFDDSARADALEPTIDRLAHDRSVAVRSCAIEALLALMNVKPDLAIRWFLECVDVDPVLLTGHSATRFLRYGAHRDHAAVRLVLRRMLDGESDPAAKAAAEICCVFALEADDVPAAEEDASRVRSGKPLLRIAAADVYGSNIGHDQFGGACLKLLKPLISDENREVRAEAAEAFRHLPKLGESEQRELLDAFLKTDPSAEALEPVTHALAESAEKLPDLAVCRLVEMSLASLGEEAGDIQKRTAGVADDLSKIVLRLYAQSGDTDVRRRCLEAIDRMALARVYGLARELERIDR
ncbi:hypothetical protein LzC2_03770 [Planctomycetes bacterium LzC2]|uniref:HEAT repeat domain-containing protein n=1 Tax=Alienimonas chondri TaxID=2681879 RepID=A0ABX1VA54_9PLAN|nr:hypothetical protein [Alienimonas chondri]